MKQERMVTHWYVRFDTDGDGPGCDGVVTQWFRSEFEAKRFAGGRTCYGRPATVGIDTVPHRVAVRRGMANP